MDDCSADEYLWLKHENSCKNITYKRFMLDNMARRHNINPDIYKNKKMVLEAIIEYWEDKFRSEPEFKLAYERHFGVEIEL